MAGDQIAFDQVTLFDQQGQSPEPKGPGSEVGQTVRLRMVVSYDGSSFRGFADQPEVRTVAGVLKAAISRFVRVPVEITCAGRTDAGVHATGQVIHVDIPPGIDIERLARAINSTLSPTVVVREVVEAAPGFDARRSAVARNYRYLVLCAPSANPLLSHVGWLVSDRLDLRAMCAGADALLGEHDFRAFCRRAPGTAPGTPVIRKVTDARWSICPPPGVVLRDGEQLFAFDITATSFCHQMVRSVVGVLVDVGRGKRPASEIVRLLRSGDRSRAMTVAPPHGLCLTSVLYSPDSYSEP